MDEAAVARIALALEELGVDAERRGPREWVALVPCARRGPLGVLVACGDRTLSLQAFYMRGPDRGHEAVYRRLLRKHLDMREWRFALDDSGDLYLAAEVPLAGLDADALDGLLGAVSTYVDETWETVMRTGFDVPEGTVFGPPPGG